MFGTLSSYVVAFKGKVFSLFGHPTMIVGENPDGDPVTIKTDASGNLLISSASANAGAANLNTGQVITSTTGILLVIARPTRTGLLVRNLDTSLPVYVGPQAVTIGNGMLIKAGESLAMTFTGLIQVVAVSGTPTVAFADEYD